MSELRNCLAVIALFCLLLSSVSCIRDNVDLPIKEEKLIDVLSDVHIIEGALANILQTQKDSIAHIYYEQVYEKHDIKETDFISTLETLEANPKILSKIYSQVLIRLDTLEEYSYKSVRKKK